MEARTKNLLLAGGALVLLIVAGLISMLRASPTAEYPDETDVYAVDLRTGEEHVLHVKLTDRPPYLNGDSGERTLYPWYICWECKYRFVPEPVPDRDGGPPRIPMIPACPGCGSGDVSPWSPAMSELAEPVGDAPLPKLP